MDQQKPLKIFQKVAQQDVFTFSLFYEFSKCYLSILPGDDSAVPSLLLKC